MENVVKHMLWCIGVELALIANTPFVVKIMDHDTRHLHSGEKGSNMHLGLITAEKAHVRLIVFKHHPSFARTTMTSVVIVHSGDGADKRDIGFAAPDNN